MNVVLGQLGDLLGARAEGDNALVKAWHVITNPAGINAAATSAGVGALALLIVIDRTRIALFGSLIAVVVPTVVVALCGGGSVATVSNTGAIPSRFPPLALPHLADLRPGLISGALVAIVLIQGAGVAQAAPNPNGTLSSTDRDFIGQGIANAASGLRPGELREIWRTGRTSQVALAGTFVAVLLLPRWQPRWASACSSPCCSSSTRTRLTCGCTTCRTPGRRAGRTARSAQLPDRQPVILDVYGSLLYAGARTLEARLPDPRDADGPIVILRLRGRTSLGATFFAVAAGYSDALSRDGGRL